MPRRPTEADCHSVTRATLHYSLFKYSSVFWYLDRSSHPLLTLLLVSLFMVLLFLVSFIYHNSPLASALSFPFFSTCRPSCLLASSSSFFMFLLFFLVLLSSFSLLIASLVEWFFSACLSFFSYFLA